MSNSDYGLGIKLKLDTLNNLYLYPQIIHLCLECRKREIIKFIITFNCQLSSQIVILQNIILTVTFPIGVESRLQYTVRRSWPSTCKYDALQASVLLFKMIAP